MTDKKKNNSILTMTTIKSYTDLSQSKKLAEILPLESADMYYEKGSGIGGSDIVRFGNYADMQIAQNMLGIKTIPCWSLAALLNVLPKDKSIDCAISFGYYNGNGEYIEKWICSFEKEGETTDDFIIETTDGDNNIDACYNMVIKLHERNLL